MVKGIKRTRPSCAVARMVPETHMQDSFFLSMIDSTCGTPEYVRNLTAFKVPSFLEDHSETRSRRKFGLCKAVRKGDKANVRGRKAVESVAERSETQNSRVTGNIEELNAMFDSFDNFELEIENYNPRSQSNIDKENISTPVHWTTETVSGGDRSDKLLSSVGKDDPALVSESDRIAADSVGHQGEDEAESNKYRSSCGDAFGEEVFLSESVLHDVHNLLEGSLNSTRKVHSVAKNICEAESTVVSKANRIKTRTTRFAGAVPDDTIAMPVRGKYGKTASRFDRTDFLSNGKNSISSYNEMRNGCLFNSANNSFLSSYQKAGAGHLCGSRNGNSYVTTEVTHSSEFSPDAKTSQSGQRSSCSGDADNECSEEDSSVKRLQRSYKSGLSLSSKSVYLQGEAGAKEPRRLSSEKLIETSNQDSQIQLSTAALNFSSCEASVNPFRNSCPNFTSALGDERLENVQLDCGVNHPCSAASSASCSGLVPVGRTRGESGESCPVPKFTKGDIELPLIAMTSTAGSSEVCLESYFIPSEGKNRRKHSVKIFFDTTTSQTETSSRETDFDHRFLQSDQHNVSANTRSEIKHEGKILDGDVGGLCRQDIAETDGLNLIRSGAAIATSTPIRNSQRVPDDAEIQMLTSLLSPKLSVASNDEENKNAQTYGGLEREERGANDEDVEPIEERLNVLSLSTLINPLHYGFDLEEEHGTSRSILYTSRSSHSISMLDIDKNQVPFYLSGCPFWSNSYRRNRNYFNELLFICDQQNVSSWFPGRKLLNLYGAVKLGEGTFGEVYLVQYKDQRVAMKVIPIGGTYAINNESQKSFETILPEVIISKELSDLRSPTLMNRTDGFIRLVGFHLVQGTYPRALRTAWKKYAKISTSLNDDPSILPKNQHYILLCYEIGGIELEKFELDSIEQAYSITYQVAFSLLIAEEELFFEHRDLHDGNILIQKDYSVAVCSELVYGEEITILTHGAQVRIIDYSLSRISKGGTTIYYDLAADEEVFEGKGNFQFDIYRLMRKATRNQWQKYTPITNVLWLIYVERNLYEKLEKNQIGTCEQRLCFLQFFASLERSQTVGDWLYSTEMPHFLRA